jgi:hypothetical protein
MAESKKKFTTETLLEKFPVEKCWEITAKILMTFALLRGEKSVATEMSKGEGIISPVLGAEKWQELTKKAWGEEGGRNFFPWVKEVFNISVEDAIGAAKLVIVVGALFCGPEIEYEIVEEAPERVVIRYDAKCPWWNRWKEQEVAHEVFPCYPIHEAFFEGGLKVINPKLTNKITKAMERGDPYCEDVIEFKEK